MAVPEVEVGRHQLVANEGVEFEGGTQAEADLALKGNLEDGSRVAQFGKYRFRGTQKALGVTVNRHLVRTAQREGET